MRDSGDRVPDGHDGRRQMPPMRTLDDVRDFAPASDSLLDNVIQRVAQTQGFPSARMRAKQIDAGRVDALCDALVSNNPTAAWEFITELQARGVSPDSLFQDYIAMAARRMGERWVDDCASFMDVTLAGGRLFSLIRSLASVFVEEERTPGPGQTILIATVPGETHSLGAAIAAEYFRRGAWDVTLLDGGTLVEIESQILERNFSVVGLSAGSRRMLDPLKTTVDAVRAASQSALVCIGGHILELEPDVVTLTGADHGAADPGSMTVLLERHLARRNALAEA